ncbi:unnamed protein product [Gemmata massiliana]|uniref:Uncharacterized protein n=1 Tax=Gemmata massiliana TaxID=1210884 RepID=A0A6P2CT47_9BACT|nr:unnamed protein product [Gemmata massiliana]
MSSTFFRLMAGLIGAFGLFVTIMMAREGLKADLLLGVLFALFFLSYAVLGEYKLRWLLMLLGAKDQSSKRSGRGNFRSTDKTSD